MRGYKKIDYNSEDLSSFSIGELKKITDHHLREYLIRNTPNKSGKYKCPLKKKWFDVSQMDVAHFIDRGIMNLRFDLRNCHLISSTSNRWDAQIVVEGYKSLHHKEYSEWLGEDLVNQLEKESKELKIYSKEELIELIEKFRDGN